MSKLESHLTAATPFALSLFRVALGLVLVLHATQKLFAWPIDAGSYDATAMAFGSSPVWWMGLIELVSGLLLLVGLVTRFAALVAAGELVFAYVTWFQPRGSWPMENGGELTLVVAIGLLVMVFAGGGAWAVDELRRP